MNDTYHYAEFKLERGTHVLPQHYRHAVLLLSIKQPNLKILSQDRGHVPSEPLQLDFAVNSIIAILYAQSSRVHIFPRSRLYGQSTYNSFLNTGKYIADFPDSVLSSCQTKRQVAPTRFHLTEVQINGIPCKLAQAHHANERPVLEAFKTKGS